MTGLESLRRDVFGVIKNEKCVYPGYGVPPRERRPEIYAVAQTEEISFGDLLICGDVKTYDAEIKLKISIFGNPSGDPGCLYEFADSRIIDPFAKSGYSLKKVSVGGVRQNSDLGKMLLESVVVLGARTAEV